jgi:hypothetical protein
VIVVLQNFLQQPDLNLLLVPALPPVRHPLTHPKRNGENLEMKEAKMEAAVILKYIKIIIDKK